jgi:hypothetical protein
LIDALSILKENRFKLLFAVIFNSYTRTLRWTLDPNTEHTQSTHNTHHTKKSGKPLLNDFTSSSTCTFSHSFHSLQRSSFTLSLPTLSLFLYRCLFFSLFCSIFSFFLLLHTHDHQYPHSTALSLHLPLKLFLL